MARKSYQFKPARGLARVARIALGLGMMINLYGALVYLGIGAAGDYRAEDTLLTTPQKLQAIADLTVYLGNFLIIPLLLWIHRTSTNAHALQPRMKHSVAASIYWYLVPLASLFFPFEATYEVWKVSSPGRFVARRDDRLLRIWWGLFLTTNFVSIAANASGMTSIRGVYCVLGLGLSTILIVMIGRLLSLQTAAHLSENFGESEPVSILEAQTA